VRVDRLLCRGVVARESDDTDARVTRIRLTGEGLRLFDEIAPLDPANEDRLLSALDDDERDALAGLLRRLLASFEPPTVDGTRPRGLVIEPHTGPAPAASPSACRTPPLCSSPRSCPAGPQRAPASPAVT
jgi:hypothetical protein